MNCTFNEKYELGKLSQEDYQKHVEDCDICQSILEQDKKLIELTSNLKQPVSAPNLWKNIKQDLKQEQEKSSWMTTIRRNKTPIYALAAVLIVAIGLTIFLPKSSIDQDSPVLLTNSLLEEVQETELAYEQAINELEDATQNKFTELDIELSLLYRDRLETIDIQIARCKEALNENPANAHIRRYLLAALQDKKETLTEILQFEI